MKFYFNKDYYNNNKSYEKLISKFLILVYLTISISLLLSCNLKDDEEFTYIEGYTKLFDEYCFININENKHLSLFTQNLK